MINDIRISASQLLNYSENIKFQTGNLKPEENYQNTVEIISQKQESNIEANEAPNKPFMQLGIPAGFNIDFSLLEEMEKAESNN